MAGSTLFFARAKLLRLGLLSATLGFGAVLIALRWNGNEGFVELREAYLFHAFGRHGPRAFMLLFGLLFGLAGLGALLRLAKDLEAATIRVDGLQVASLFRSRMIPWRYLESVTLGATRIGGKVHHRLAIRSRRLPAEGRLHYLFSRHLAIPAGRLDATPSEIASWVGAAEAARRRALLYRADAPAAPAAKGARA